MLMPEPSLVQDEVRPAVDQPWFTPRYARTLLALVLVAIYLPGLAAPFIFDDFLNLVHNSQITTLWPQPQSWRESRPVGFYTFALQYVVHGLWPAGFRAVNVAIHFASACLLMALVRQTLQQCQPRWSPERCHRVAFLTAVLWSVHPLATAAVTCIVQRFESLMGLCFFGVLYSLLRSTQSSRPRVWQAAAVLLCWLGLGTKEVMATVLLVAPLYDRLFLAQAWSVVLRQRGAAYLTMAAGVVWLGWVSSHAYAPGANATAGFALEGISWWDYLRSQPAVLLHYVRLALWPDQLYLDYGWPVEHDPLRIYGVGALVLAILLLGGWCLVRNQSLGFLLLAPLLVLAPTSSFLPIADLAFEHRVYVPLAALALAVALGIDRWLAWGWPREPLGAALLLILVALSLRTGLRNREYVDPAVIWQQVIAMNPQHARAHFLLGEHWARQRRDREALAAYAAALAVRPDYIAALNNAALAEERLGYVDDALVRLAGAVAMAPHDTRLKTNYGKMLARHARWHEARQVFQELERAHPHDQAFQALLRKVEEQLSASSATIEATEHE